jgi:hypothetical protein
MNRRAFMFTAIAGAASAAAPAWGFEREQALAKANQHGWRTAPAPAGAIGWETLSATKGEERTINGFTWLLPSFPPNVRALDGKTVKVPGFIIKVDTQPRYSRFLLTAYPPSCPFCLDVGPAFFIDVQLQQPTARTDIQDAVLVEGRLTLLERDGDGLFYRLTGARFAT